MAQVGAHLPPEPRDPTQPPNFYTEDNTAPDPNVIVVEDDTGGEPQPSEFEAEAREMGWVPAEEWRGPKERWVDARLFVERGRTVLPIVNAQLARERAEKQALQARLQQLETEASEWRKYREQQTDASAQVQETALRAQRRQALEAGDYDSVNEIDNKLLDLRVEAKLKASAPKPEARVDPELQRVWDDFRSKNEWLQDPKLMQAWGLEMRNMRQLGVTTSGAEFMADAADRVKRMYPEKFSTRRRTAIGDTNGSPSDGGTNGRRSFHSLKAEYKETAQRLVKDGTLKNVDQFVAECGPEAFIGA